LRAINEIIIHCSDSDFGDRDIIDSWHRKRGWDGIGYHYIITNCYPYSHLLRDKTPDIKADGEVQLGREIHQVGAHCKGNNSESIGICLIGKDTFTGKQLNALIKLIKHLQGIHDLNNYDIKGHYEYNPLKTCPNIEMNHFRKLL
jgi:N-acetylmuramoyl-L-alanine amidase